jgi:hypothetical protein
VRLRCRKAAAPAHPARAGRCLTARGGGGGNGSGYLDHSEVVRLVRFLRPTSSLADLRFLMANLYIIDTDEDGKISIDDMLRELGLWESPRRSRSGEGSPRSPARAHTPSKVPPQRPAPRCRARRLRFQTWGPVQLRRTSPKLHCSFSVVSSSALLHHTSRNGSIWKPVFVGMLSRRR